MAEGVEFNAAGKCDLAMYMWYPEGSEPVEDEQISLFSGV
jgi:hypothetical protein